MSQNRQVIYGYHDAKPTTSAEYEWPTVKGLIEGHPFQARRAVDLGCGNGRTTGMLAALGFDATGLDPSPSGIEHAQEAFPACHFHLASSDDDLVALYGKFDLVLSLDVLPVCLDSWEFARSAFSLLEPGGLAVISTPYHGFLKNLAIVLSGRFDKHFDPLWHSSLIRFFSVQTFEKLLTEVGFVNIKFVREGRIPSFAKSIIAVATK